MPDDPHQLQYATPAPRVLASTKARIGAAVACAGLVAAMGWMAMGFHANPVMVCLGIAWFGITAAMAGMIAICGRLPRWLR
jgi:hypothetical protein